MPKNKRQEKWRTWHAGVCAPIPEFQKLRTEEWPTRLAVAVEEIFSDQSLAEPQRLAKAVESVLAHYTKTLAPERRQAIAECLAEAVRLQVQDDFEHWKTQASVA